MLFSNGVAGILGINHVSIGLTVDVNFLTDRNSSSSRMYQHKPWQGSAFGLNLN